MIDWTKPIEWKGRPATFIGFLRGNSHVIIQTVNDLIYRVDSETGRVLNHSYENERVQNEKTDWEKAFEKYCLEEDKDRPEEYIFKRAFELGRDWKCA